MIVQKEVKFALGLTVIFTLLGAAIFVYKGDQKDKTPDDTAVAAANTGNNTRTETEAAPETASGTETTSKEPVTETVIEFTETEESTESTEFTTNETEVVTKENIEEPEVRTETEIPDPFQEETEITETVEPETTENVVTEEIVLPPFEEEETEPVTEVTEEVIDLTEEQEEVQPRVVGGTEYTIKKGDMLSTIAAKVYGRAHLWKIIQDANPHIVPSEMMPGQKIILPKYTPKSKTPTVKPAEQEEKFPEGVMVYTIKRGDTLSGISKKFYGTSTKWQDIQKANNIADEYNIPAGKKIIIPGVKPKAVRIEQPERKKADLPDLSGLPSAGNENILPDTGTNATHIVREGETLWSIAQLYFNDGMKYKELIKANPGINQDRLKAGQKVMIPGIQSKIGADGTEYFIYTVKEGDYLSTIAEDFLGKSSRWREITVLNKGLNPNRIYVGQKIKIPGSRPSPAGTSSEKSNDDLPDLSFEKGSGANQFIGSSGQGGNTYVVKKGDSLGEISTRVYGSVKYMKDILNANPHIKDADTLYVGAKLRMPNIKGTRARSGSGVREPSVRTESVSGKDSYLGGGKKPRAKKDYVLRGFGR
ncbi:LysM peptidoglycan-binding domain-containing protein [Planctomycetota bacterium]